MHHRPATITWRDFVLSGAVFTTFWLLGVMFWYTSGYLQPILFFGAIGTFVGIGLGLYAVLPKPKKPLGRRVALLLVGLLLMLFSVSFGQENMQIEGFFFSCLAGFAQAALVHYLIAKVIGPMLFGRIWCGWACWTVMVLDLLPYQRSSGRVPGHWGWIRYLHFGVSLGLVLLLWYGIGYRSGHSGRIAVYWFAIGNVLYYLIGIGLAMWLKDNRAFCKYVCPVVVVLKLTAPFALLKVKGDGEKCTECMACVKACPMDIRIPEYTKQGRRVLSTECSLCQTCITVCATGALSLSVGLDIGGKDLLRFQADALRAGHRG